MTPWQSAVRGRQRITNTSAARAALGHNQFWPEPTLTRTPRDSVPRTQRRLPFFFLEILITKLWPTSDWTIYLACI